LGQCCPRKRGDERDTKSQSTHRVKLLKRHIE
jgi:hypothetical protein